METGHVVKIERILHPTDFSDSSQYALGYARRFAQEFGAKLCLLHVVEDVTQMMYFDMMQAPPLGTVIEAMREQAQKQLDELSADVEGIEIERILRRGVPFHEIVRVAREIKADIIVMGTHGRTGLKHALFGSVAEKVVRKAPCPVLTVRHPEQKFEMP